MTPKPVQRPEPVGHDASEAGFTLIEALIATLMLAVGLSAVINLFVVAGSSNHAANHGTAATTAATETMERLKSTPFTNLVPGGDLASDAAGFFRRDTLPGVGQILTRWQVVQVDGQTLFLRVRSESEAALAGPRTRSEFTSFRVCTATASGCPNP